VTDRQTDSETDRANPAVKTGRIYVRNTATRPNKMDTRKPSLEVAQTTETFPPVTMIFDLRP